MARDVILLVDPKDPEKIRVLHKPASDRPAPVGWQRWLSLYVVYGPYRIEGKE
jgi:hypothetical protein